VAPDTRFMQIGQLPTNLTDWLRTRNRPLDITLCVPHWSSWWVEQQPQRTCL